MSQIDTFGAYVRARLEEWGREFCLARDCEYLGHQSKNMLQVLIEHRGDMPGRAQGYKPMEVSQPAHQIELMVTDMARDQPDLACVMRGYYCGSGRRKVERYETAILLISVLKNAPPLPKIDRYLRMVEIGTAQIRGSLVATSMAAQ